MGCGLFSFKTSVVGDSITRKTFSMFDDATLTRLQSTKKKAEDFNYKLDHITSINNSVYYIGEQYQEKSLGPFEWSYDYRDIMIVKLNANSEFQWVKQVPLRYDVRQKYRHIFKQYIAYATAENIYILFNDNPVNTKYYQEINFKPENVSNVEAIHGSDFVCNSINLKDGNWKRNVLFRNNTYCFVPIRNNRPKFVLSSEEVLYLPLKKNSIYIHTEDRGSDKFDILTFE